MRHTSGKQAEVAFQKWLNRLANIAHSTSPLNPSQLEFRMQVPNKVEPVLAVAP
jgi:hypothetical protein